MRRIQVNFKQEDFVAIERYTMEYGYISKQHFFQCLLRYVYIHRDEFIRWIERKQLLREGDKYRDKYGIKILLDITDVDLKMLNFFIRQMRLKSKSIAWSRGFVYSCAYKYVFLE